MVNGNKKIELILICNNFPINKGESFLAIEFPYLEKRFNSITTILRNQVNSSIEILNNNIHSLPAKSNFWSNILNLISFLVYFPKTFSMLTKELYFLKKNSILTKKNILKAFHDLIKAFEINRYLKKLISKDKNYIIYSYWQNNAAIAATMLSQQYSNCKSVCRAHGGDLYAYRYDTNYLSYRQYISEYINKLYFISQDGLNYQSHLLNRTFSNFNLAKLGTNNTYPYSKKKNTSHHFKLVSCSNAIPLKRIHLIIEALALCSINIEWFHFGDGISLDSLKLLAKEKLSPKNNISYTFKGFTENDKLLEFYSKNNIDLFINVSETEGIPVSIMEAMSFGIPAIATNVGGTSELVNNDCGRIIPKNCTAKEIAKYIEDEIIANKSIRAYNKWDEEFNASSNFTKFADDLLKLFS